MNSFVRICPQCNRHTKYSLDKGTSTMLCGFTSRIKNKHKKYNGKNNKE